MSSKFKQCFDSTRRKIIVIFNYCFWYCGCYYRRFIIVISNILCSNMRSKELIIKCLYVLNTFFMCWICSERSNVILLSVFFPNRIYSLRHCSLAFVMIYSCHLWRPSNDHVIVAFSILCMIIKDTYIKTYV